MASTEILKSMQLYWSILSDMRHYQAPFTVKGQLILNTLEKITAIGLACLIGIVSFGLGGVVSFFALAAWFKCRHLSRQQDIYIFCGGDNHAGVSIESMEALTHKIQDIAKTAHISSCHAQTLTPLQWNKRGILVLPGGQCADWDQVLNSEQKQAIMHWVKHGGKILGICAGAYYCSSQSLYQLSSTQKIERVRELQLFSGLCKGPAYGAEMQAVKVRWEKTGKIGHVLMIKGGKFISKESNYEVLARYMDSPCQDEPAVIRCQSGSILSGPHWEFDSSHLEPLKSYSYQFSSSIEQTQQQLDEGESFRRACLQEMMNDLIINF